jgi:hypothetical protein
MHKLLNLPKMTAHQMTLSLQQVLSKTAESMPQAQTDREHRNRPTDLSRGRSRANSQNKTSNNLSYASFGQVSPLNMAALELQSAALKNKEYRTMAQMKSTVQSSHVGTDREEPCTNKVEGLRLKRKAETREGKRLSPLSLF